MNIKRYETPYLKVIRFDIKKDVMEMVTENFYGDETQVYESNPTKYFIRRFYFDL